MLGADGPFAGLIEGFAPREVQIEMAERVERIIREDGALVIEAGTGVGKTFAYLVPALLCGRKVIISTGTRNLQDQLFHKDLPLVRRALGLGLRVALLKGRANYLCRERLETALSAGRLGSREQVGELAAIGEWAGYTRRGDIAEVEAVPEDSSVWPLVTSTTENCLGTDCPHYDRCLVLQARREAQEADVVVINHHLFLADLALKEEGFGELLPGANAFILDEAHQLPEVASGFFGQSLSGRQLVELARDVTRAQLVDAPEVAELRSLAADLEAATQRFRAELGRAGLREDWLPVLVRGPVRTAVDGLVSAVEELGAALEQVAGRGRELEQCGRRCLAMSERLTLLSEPPAGHIAWYETFRSSFAIHITPLEIAGVFQGRMQAYRAAWVFTSATLSVGEDFGYFTRRLGLSEVETARLESPFDYHRNALLYLPPAMPDPNDPKFTGRVIDGALPVLEASGGRAFLLFTSHRALREAAERLRHEVDFPVLVQGEMPRGSLLAHFRELGNAVLLGTSSFWEGVDVRGEALSCVIIDRLPFASPGDPVLRARLGAIEEQGGDPFWAYQIPQAVITLRQGIGRLVRDVDDRGVLVICDPRILRRGYGRTFLDALPAMPRTQELEEVQHFFEL
jgi:ATP-dependent DNA helicase DinG